MEITVKNQPMRIAESLAVAFMDVLVQRGIISTATAVKFTANDPATTAVKSTTNNPATTQVESATNDPAPTKVEPATNDENTR